MKKRIAILLAAVLVFMLSGCDSSKAIDYQKAKGYFENKDYETAIYWLEGLDGFEDSADLLRRARFLRLGQHLQTINSEGHGTDYMQTVTAGGNNYYLMGLMAGKDAEHIHAMIVTGSIICYLEIGVNGDAEVVYSLDDDYTRIPFDIGACTLETIAIEDTSVREAKAVNTCIKNILAFLFNNAEELPYDITLEDLGFYNLEAA